VKSSEVDKGCENSSNTYFAVILDHIYCRSLSLICFGPEWLSWLTLCHAT